MTNPEIDALAGRELDCEIERVFYGHAKCALNPSRVAPIDGSGFARPVREFHKDLNLSFELLDELGVYESQLLFFPNAIEVEQTHQIVLWSRHDRASGIGPIKSTAICRAALKLRAKEEA